MPYDKVSPHLPAWDELTRWASEGSIPPLRCPDCGSWLPRMWSHEQDYEDGRPVHIKYAICPRCRRIEKRYA
jgi:hypothetical protein